uniref:Uncharacterized protein n=1 Tax=Pyrodinium bahamense TaxID=73915 RepID=A0A7S0ANR6_9DINO|mmetsp:Transcript_38216/g.106511  ORF Transcript_38216/g.106511 Transcript_38216/m.106511 type:complete len:407 (+) Transcript_38216:148-1368(+)
MQAAMGGVPWLEVPFSVLGPAASVFTGHGCAARGAPLALARSGMLQPGPHAAAMASAPRGQPVVRAAPGLQANGFPSSGAQGPPPGLAASTVATAAALAGARQRRRPSHRCTARHSARTTQPAAVATPGGSVEVASTPAPVNMPEELKDIAVAGGDTKTPHWSQQPMRQEAKGLRLEQLDWMDLHGAACVLSGVLFLLELVRFVLGQPPSDVECYSAAVIYATIYASRFSGIRVLAPHFRVTFYATTGWTIYYIAHLLAATTPELFAHSIYPAGIVFLASTIYFYKHWLERMWRHFMEDRFRPYYVPGLLGLMYFHVLDVLDMFNQWLDSNYWAHVPVTLPDQAWTIQDVRLTGLFMSSMALFMITLHNKGVLTGGRNTLITVLFTIFVPALFLTGTHATLQASFP